MRKVGLIAFPLILLTIVANSPIWNRATFYYWLGIGGHEFLTYLTPLTLPFIFAITKDSRIDAFVGEFSYPIYIGHFLVLETSAAHGFKGGVTLMVGSICLAAILLLAVRGLEMVLFRVRLPLIPAPARPP